jgi:hypothetical protein
MTLGLPIDTLSLESLMSNLSPSRFNAAFALGETDAAKAIVRMVKRSLEIEQHPAALAGFCAREKREVEDLDKLGRL